MYKFFEYIIKINKLILKYCENKKKKISSEIGLDKRTNTKIHEPNIKIV